MKAVEKKIECLLHEEGGQVVEVAEIIHEICVEAHRAVRGVLLRYESLECNMRECPDYQRCSPLGLRQNDLCRIIDVGKAISCPGKKKLVLVQMVREPQASGNVQ